MKQERDDLDEGRDSENPEDESGEHDTERNQSPGNSQGDGDLYELRFLHGDISSRVLESIIQDLRKTTQESLIIFIDLTSVPCDKPIKSVKSILEIM